MSAENPTGQPNLSSSEIIEWASADDIRQAFSATELLINEEDAEFMIRSVMNQRVDEVRMALGTVLAGKCYYAGVRTLHATINEEGWTQLRAKAIGAADLA